ncbi:hypothetical protein ACE1CM_02120, partial [Microseira sp. BLCC-F43]
EKSSAKARDLPRNPVSDLISRQPKKPGFSEKSSAKARDLPRNPVSGLQIQRKFSQLSEVNHGN